MKETDLNRSAATALSNLEIMIREKNARVEVGDLPTVEADRTQMVQLFQNLIQNAMKFHRNSQPPHVKVFAKIGNKGKTVEICVEDNGIGFDERYLDNSVSSGGMWHQIPLRSAVSSTIRSTPSDRPASSSWSLVILWLKIR